MPDTPRVPRAVRRRRRFRRRLAVLCGVLLVVLLLGAAFLIFILPQFHNGTAEHPALFAVKTVNVEGNTHYSDSDVIAASGVWVGKSTFDINKTAVRKALLTAFPYFSDVKVLTKGAAVTLSVTESTPLCAFFDGMGFVVTGADGRALERAADLPALPLVTGVDGSPALGGQAMSAAQWALTNHLFAALAAATAPGHDELTAGLYGADITSPSDMTLNWRGQITVRLGNEVQLDHKLLVAAAALHDVLDKNGGGTRGVLDLRAYSDPNSTVGAIYTPEQAVPTTTVPVTVTTTAATGATGATGTATVGGAAASTEFTETADTITTVP